MRSTGIVRRLDSLGRLTLPKELRKSYGIEIGDPLEIFVEDDKLIIRKYNPCDVFSGYMTDDMVEYCDKKVSKESIRNLIDAAGFTVIEG